MIEPTYLFSKRHHHSERVTATRRIWIATHAKQRVRRGRRIGKPVTWATAKAASYRDCLLLGVA